MCCNEIATIAIPFMVLSELHYHCKSTTKYMLQRTHLQHLYPYLLKILLGDYFVCVDFPCPDIFNRKPVVRKPVVISLYSVTRSMYWEAKSNAFICF